MTINEGIKYQRDKIVNDIIELIKGDTAEWKSGLYDEIPEVPPEDINGNKFKGIQQHTLRLESIRRGYKDPRWLTAYEAHELRAQINQDAMPVEVLYPSDEGYFSVKYYNAEQCVGLKPYVPPRLQMVNEKIEKIIANSEAPIVFDGGRFDKETGKYCPAYSLIDDKIHLPKFEKFETKENYYATVLHEIAHSTRHPSRLNRKWPTNDIEKAVEELRAEFASIFIQSEVGLYLPRKHFENQCAYIKSWTFNLNNYMKGCDLKLKMFMINSAIKDASDIADYVRENYLKKQGGNEKSLLAKESTGEVKTWNSPALQRNIPVAMKNSPNWVPMKLYQGKGTGQNKKFFIDVNNPASGFADYRDPKTWTTYEKALDYAKANHCDGIGFAVKNSNVNAIVLNQCHDGKKGHYNETAQNLINELPDTYIEKSFSGSGLHILTTSSICENGKYQEGSGTAINVYETIGFVPVTGKVIDKNHKNLAEISEKTVEWIQNNLITSTSSKTFVQNKVNSEEIKKRGYKGR